MEKKKQRILFFTPFATRTGSEMMLLYILQRIDRSRYEIGVVSFANGDLLSEFPADIPTFVVPRQYSIYHKIKHHLGINPILQSLRKIARDFKADCWYANTMMLPETVTVAKEFSIRVITHFHELPLTYHYLNSSDMKNIVDYSELLIGCSQVTADAIEQAGGKNVALLYSFIDPDKVQRKPERSAELRKALGIPEDAFVWVASGMTSERKGFDFLPDIAEAIDDPNVHIVWVGGRIDDGMVYYTEQRCANPALKTKVHLVGQQKNDYYPYLDIGNGFLLTSRQDPFPLVMIEAALLEKPIVSFPSGGVAEFIQEGMGLVTEDISVRQMTAAMRRVMNGEISLDPQKSRSRAGEFDVENGYRNWTEIMNSLY